MDDTTAIGKQKKDNNWLPLLAVGSAIGEGVWVFTEHIPNLTFVTNTATTSSLIITAIAAWHVRNYFRLKMFEGYQRIKTGLFGKRV